MVRINIFVTKIDDGFIDNNFDILYESLYPARKEAVKKLKIKKTAYVSLTAGLLLAKAYEDIYDKAAKDIIIEKAEHGKPYIKGKEEFKYNISHSGDYVVLAYTTDEAITSIGIDIEKIKTRDDDMKIANRFFTGEEMDYISEGLECSDVDTRFYKVWTMKEAFLKYTGMGLGQRLDSFSVNPDELSIVGQSNISYDMKVIDKHIISVCVGCDDGVEYNYSQITLDKLC